MRGPRISSVTNSSMYDPVSTWTMAPRTSVPASLYQNLLPGSNWGPASPVALASRKSVS